MKVAGAVLATYAIIFASAAVFGWTRTWSAVTIPPMPPPHVGAELFAPFGDLQMVTGVQGTLDRHLDPMVEDPGDPWDRPFNYPRVWITIGTWLHWTLADTIWLGLVIFGTFIGGVFLLEPMLPTTSDRWLLYAGAMSPAALFGVERGNVDLFVFFVVCVAIAQHRRPWFQAAALGVAAVLKLYPAFGLIAPSKPDRPRYGPRLSVLALVAAYVVWYRGDLGAVRRGTMANPSLSYGVANLGRWVADLLPLRSPLPLLIAAGMAASVMLVGVWWGATARRDADEGDTPAGQMQACLVAVAIYIGSYCLRSNYDYRLVFLLPAIPYLNSLQRSGSRLGTAALCALYLTLAQTALVALAGPAGMLVNLTAKLALTGLLAAVAAQCVLHPAADRAITAVATQAEHV